MYSCTLTNSKSPGFRATLGRPIVTKGLLDTVNLVFENAAPIGVLLPSFSGAT
jgi:hypothetical protein